MKILDEIQELLIDPGILIYYEKAMATHSSTLAWEISWMEEPGRLQSMGREESDTTERLHFHFSFSCTGEGNGKPLQYSCLENPRDGGAWWAAIYGVAQSQTRLTCLSSSSMHQSGTLPLISQPPPSIKKGSFFFFTLILAFKNKVILSIYLSSQHSFIFTFSNNFLLNSCSKPRWRLIVQLKLLFQVPREFPLG